MVDIFKAHRWFNAWFQYIHQNNLVYVTCWEDPRLDRVAMKLTEADTILVLTSAGCNALDYALDSPHHVYAVDLNPRQNALLELKIAGIKSLDFETFFQLFGEGYLPDFNKVYQQKLRDHLSPFSQQYWDLHGTRLFSGAYSFFFHGTTGLFARIVNFYIDQIIRLREGFNELLSATTIEDQRRVYYDHIECNFWKLPLQKFTSNNLVLSLLGVPLQQRQQMERYLENGVADFIKNRCHEVFADTPIWDNYFWRVFLEGKYTSDCCPDYLKRENFDFLKAGAVDRVSVHTQSVAQFLEQENTQISRFVLLDHMDWLSSNQHPELEREWRAIVNNASPQSRILFRSAGFEVDYVDPIQVSVQNQNYRLGDLLTYDTDLAKQLHQEDRVRTYGSFYIADLAIS